MTRSFTGRALTGQSEPTNDGADRLQLVLEALLHMVSL
jgi:hypothetical protein